MTYADRARFYEVEYDVGAERALVLGLVGPTVRSILEIPCASGILVPELAATGRRLVAADIEPAMIVRLRQRLAEWGLAGQVAAVVADMRDFALGETFDLILMPPEAFQLLTGAGDAERALQALKRHLAPDGTLLIDLAGFSGSGAPSYFDPAAAPDRLIEDWTRPVAPNGHLTRCRRQFHDGPETIGVRYLYTFTPAAGPPTSWESTIRLRLYRRDAFEMLLRQAGLTARRVLGGYDGAPAGAAAERLIFLIGHAP